MSSVRFYFDADSMERRLIGALRDRGVDSISALDVDMTGATDEEQLKFASQQHRTLVSFNVADFCRIHAETISRGHSHAGIVLVPQQRYSLGERLRRLLKLVAARTSEEMRGRLEFLGDWT